jgi:nucleoside-diphosphate-sugar epimerase
MSRIVLITGAGGFVGSHLAEGFLAAGDSVIGLDQMFDAPTVRRLKGAKLVEAAISQEALAELGYVDLVIHGAAITTPPEELGLSHAEHIAANLGLLTLCLDFATARGVTDFVFISSSGVFSPTDGNGIHLESTNATSSIPYALAKRQGEAATEVANSEILRTLSVRLGPIYGPHETVRSTRRVVSQIRRWLDLIDSNEPIIVAIPDEHRDWTFAPDLALGVRTLLDLEPELTGVVHLTSADIISNLELAQTIGTVATGAKIISEPSGAQARLPMASVRVDMPSLIEWTSLTAGLRQTQETEVIA